VPGHAASAPPEPPPAPEPATEPAREPEPVRVPEAEDDRAPEEQLELF
jgi:hypothetical protein